MTFKRTLKVLGRVAPFSVLLLFSILTTPFIRVAHSSPAMTAMMAKAGVSSNCVTVCTSQSAVQYNDTQRKLTEVDKEPTPEPGEPYHLAFMGVGWTTGAAISAACLIKYLNWRPPDLYKLNVSYRF